jgi:hypothetical protein
MNGRENILKEVPELEALVTRDQIMELYGKRSSGQPG